MIDYIYKYLSEVKILSSLNHKNVIQYYGSWVESEENNTTSNLNNSININSSTKDQSKQHINYLKRGSL